MSISTRLVLEVRANSHRYQDWLQVQQSLDGIAFTFAERLDLGASRWRRQERAIKAAFRMVSHSLIQTFNQSVYLLSFHYRLGESNKLLWNFTDISQHSDNGGIDTLRARLEIANGPSNPSILTTQFNCEGTTLSGIDFELSGSGYRISLVKRRFVAGNLLNRLKFEWKFNLWNVLGKYICEGDGITRNIKTPTPPSASPSPYSRPG